MKKEKVFEFSKPPKKKKESSLKMLFKFLIDELLQKKILRLLKLEKDQHEQRLLIQHLIYSHAYYDEMQKQGQWKPNINMQNI